MFKTFGKVLKDILTEPNSDDYSFIQVVGLIGFFFGCGLEFLDVMKTGTFESRDFFESVAFYLLSVGGVYGAYHGINIFKQKFNQENKL